MAQTLAWLNPRMYMPTKPTTIKAISVPAAGEAVVLSDILLVLNLRSHQWRCNSAVCASARRDFSFSSLVTRPLWLTWGFSPSSEHNSYWGELSLSSQNTRAGSQHPLMDFLVTEAIFTPLGQWGLVLWPPGGIPSGRSYTHPPGTMGVGPGICLCVWKRQPVPAPGVKDGGGNLHPLLELL